MCAQHDAIKFDLLREAMGEQLAQSVARNVVFVLRLALVRAFADQGNRRKAHSENFFAQSPSFVLSSFYFEAIFSLNTKIIWKLFMIKRKLQLLNLTTVRFLLIANISLS